MEQQVFYHYKLTAVNYYRNYFQYAYGMKNGMEYTRKSSTRKMKPKKYKE